LLYTNTGNFPEAEPLLIEAMKMRLKLFGQINSEYASSLNNLALLYSKMGNLKDAENHYLEAIKIMSKIPNSQYHPNYAASLNSLGLIYLEKGDYSAALATLNTSMEIISHQGADHPGY